MACTGNDDKHVMTICAFEHIPSVKIVHKKTERNPFRIPKCLPSFANNIRCGILIASGYCSFESQFFFVREKLALTAGQSVRKERSDAERFNRRPRRGAAANNLWSQQQKERGSPGHPAQYRNLPIPEGAVCPAVKITLSASAVSKNSQTSLINPASLNSSTCR